MSKLNKKYLLKKTKGGKVAFYLSMATIAFMGLVGFDACVPGNANSIKATNTPFKGIYATRQIKGNNVYANNLASHQPFHAIAQDIASHKATIYGSGSHYYHKPIDKNLGHGMVLVGEGNKKYHMTNSQWKHNQAQAKADYNHTVKGENNDGQYVVNQNPLKASHKLNLK